MPILKQKLLQIEESKKDDAQTMAPPLENHGDVKLKNEIKQEKLEKQDKEERSIFKPDGTVMQKNEADLTFVFTEDKTNVILDIKIPKLIDTSLISVDIQPTYVTVIVKVRKILTNCYFASKMIRERH